MVGGGGGGGESWPLLFSGLARTVTFPTWPRPSRRLPGPPGSLSHGEGTFSICRASRDLRLQLSNYIPFTKNNLDLKTYERIRKERSEVEKCGQGASGLGLGHRKWLLRPLSTHPRTCQPGAFPSAVCAA